MNVYLENTFARDLPDMFDPWMADQIAQPKALVINDRLANELGIDVAWLHSDEGTRFLVGNTLAPGSTPIAQAYAGHQFGGYSPRLGDGRALLLGELITPDGRRVDLHLKGSGRTRFARNGDGKAAVGPMLREYVISEAMHALGIPTTRALAVVATNEMVRREQMLPGAVLCRVASSHLRIGSFQYAATLSEDHVARLVDYSIERHYPKLATADNKAFALLEAVVTAQADLVAKWIGVGFVHGVMNTDNMTISGETIDYGPCAFIDTYRRDAVFSSIDEAGRYAFANQPHIARWNIERFAETLLPLIGSDQDEVVAKVTKRLNWFPYDYRDAWHFMMSDKLGISRHSAIDSALFKMLLELFAAQKLDYTNGMRALSDVLRNKPEKMYAQLSDRAPFDDWVEKWIYVLGIENRDFHEIADEMDRVNPAYIPRNHLVEIALDAATNGDFGPLNELMEVLSEPFTERPGLDKFTQPMPADWEGYQTFCGT